MNNRVIKFRVWDSKNLKMIPAEDVPWVEVSIGGKFVNLLTVAFVDGEAKGLIPQQFTGLFDRNGKKIFEGDIIKDYAPVHHNPILDQVIFENGAFCTDSVEITDDCEIVGNIFENPELLKDDERN